VKGVTSVRYAEDDVSSKKNRRKNVALKPSRENTFCYFLSRPRGCTSRGIICSGPGKRLCGTVLPRYGGRPGLWNDCQRTDAFRICQSRRSQFRRSSNAWSLWSKKEQNINRIFTSYHTTSSCGRGCFSVKDGKERLCITCYIR